MDGETQPGVKMPMPVDVPETDATPRTLHGPSALPPPKRVLVVAEHELMYDGVSTMLARVRFRLYRWLLGRSAARDFASHRVRPLEVPGDDHVDVECRARFAADRACQRPADEIPDTA